MENASELPSTNNEQGACAKSSSTDTVAIANGLDAMETSDRNGKHDSSNLGPNDSFSCCRNGSFDEDERQNQKVFVDVFRLFHPDQKEMYTCWNTKTRARETNYGTRIDYILSTIELSVSGFVDCNIRADIQGSDHCPVEATVKTAFTKSPIVPNCCAIFMPECCGKQKQIKSYFVKNTSSKRELDLDEQVTCSSKRHRTAKPRETKNLNNYFGKISDNNKNKHTDGHRSVNSANALAGITNNGQIDIEQKSGAVSTVSKKTDSANFVKLDTEEENLLKVNQQCNEKIRSKNYSGRNKSWKSIFKGPEPLPPCTGHGEPSVLRTVKKEGANFGRQFYVCHRPAGHSTNKDASCNFFKWKNK